MAAERAGISRKDHGGTRSGRQSGLHLARLSLHRRAHCFAAGGRPSRRPGHPQIRPSPRRFRREAEPENRSAEPGPQEIFDSGDAHWWDGGQRVKPSESFAPRKIDNPLDKITRRQSGRRSRTHTERKRGRYIQARPAGEDKSDIAFDATFRAAAPHQLERGEQREEVAFAIQREDLQRKVRVKRAANLVLFVVDASWSMAVAERMSAT